MELFLLEGLKWSFADVSEKAFKDECGKKVHILFGVYRKVLWYYRGTDAFFL